MESTATDDLGEDSDVILEVGFDGKGLDLLELSERSAMGDLIYKTNRVIGHLLRQHYGYTLVPSLAFSRAQ
nr:hypothetical protein CFP56_40257 [Quercus suber]